MEIRNIAVIVNAGAVDPDLVALASELARRHHAALTGMAAAEPPLVVMGMDGGAVAASVYAEQHAEIEATLAASEQSFAAMVPPGIKHRWLQAVQRPEVATIGFARSVDLIVVGSSDQQAPLGQAIDVSAVLLGAGRPVLVSAHGARKLKATKILVAWKDTKEARRAVVDALPFLKVADDVAVVVVDEGNLAVERASMLDVVAWLQSHDVKAHGDVLPDIGGVSQTIVQAAQSAGADLIVSGAYGHNRLREWIFGGMTRELLATPGINRLFSN
ncbi:universal stress protein [Devosia sp. SL43]|uniref:universal stress protein n=1 Tax=Devosia sp. SL43 TaxID=2806348 RepID=UPI001F246437|nr:universal stress protein [Devosia sp. SL43]UJW85016.1 universal stress protein [Devosia sp. SL43]